jgi:hypothetical protein
VTGGRGVGEELTATWHTVAMPTGRHVGHGVPIIADQSRTTRAVAKAAELAPIIAELREDGITNPLAEAIIGMRQQVSCTSGSGWPSDTRSALSSFGRADMRQVARLMMSALTLSACAHKSLIQEKTDEFIGEPLSAVTSKLGAPTEECEGHGHGNAPGLLQKRLAPSPNIVGARPSVTFSTRRWRPDSARVAG